MKDLIKDKAFRFGFAITTCLFIGLNIFIYLYLLNKYNTHINESATSTMTFSMMYYVGLPFPNFIWTNYSNNYIIWQGIVGNIISMIIFSFLIGLIFKFVWSKFTSKQLK